MSSTRFAVIKYGTLVEEVMTYDNWESSDVTSQRIPWYGMEATFTGRALEYAKNFIEEYRVLAILDFMARITKTKWNLLILKNSENLTEAHSFSLFR